MINILFDTPLNWQRVQVKTENYQYLPEWAKGGNIWNLNEYRLILIADRPPEVGSVSTCIIATYKERSKKKVAGIVMPEYLMLRHTAIKIVGQRSGQPDQSISQMIKSGAIPTGRGHAGGQGKPDMYGEDPARRTIVMPRELEGRVQKVANDLKIPFNRLVVTLIEIGESGDAWDGETLIY